MRVALVGPESEENLGLRYLAACLEPLGHEVRIFSFDGADAESVRESVIAFEPALIGFSMSFQAMAREYLRLARAFRSDGFRGHMTAGGHFPTLTYEALLRDCEALDSVVVGEGEVTLPELVRRLGENGDWRRIPAVGCRGASGTVECPGERSTVADLDRLPFPVRTDPVPRQVGIPMASLAASRGCLGSCSFCSIRSFHRVSGCAPYRVRSPGNVADEMEWLREAKGVRLFIFHDDNFLGMSHEKNLARMESLADELRRRDLRDVALVIKSRPESVRPDLFSTLEGMGLVRVYVGVESGNRAGLDTYGRGVTLKTIDRALSTIQGLGVFGCYNVLVFFPEATVSSIREDIAFMRTHNDLPFNFGRVEVYSGTPLEKRLRKERRLSGNYMSWNYRIHDDRAELAFRISSIVFRSRSFGLEGVANTLTTLGYEPDLLRMTVPDCNVDEETDGVKSLIRKTNENTLDYLSAIVDFADSRQALKADCVSQFARDTALAVNRDDLDLFRSIADLRSRLAVKRNEAIRALAPTG